MPKVTVNTFSVPAKDLITGAARLCFDGKCVTVFNPAEGSKARKAMDAALEASPSSSSAFPSGATSDRKRARDNGTPGTTTTDEDDPVMSIDDFKTWCRDELELSDEQIAKLCEKYFGGTPPAEDEEGEQAGHPVDFEGRPHAGGEMTKSANDILLAVDRLPTKGAKKAELRRLAAIGAASITGQAGMATDAASDLASLVMRNPQARAMKMAMDQMPAGSPARAHLAEQLRDLAAQDAAAIAMDAQNRALRAMQRAASPEHRAALAMDAAKGAPTFESRWPNAARIKVL